MLKAKIDENNYFQDNFSTVYEEQNQEFNINKKTG